MQKKPAPKPAPGKPAPKRVKSIAQRFRGERGIPPTPDAFIERSFVLEGGGRGPILAISSGEVRQWSRLLRREE